jgi:hypothetical protein
MSEKGHQDVAVFRLTRSRSDCARAIAAQPPRTSPASRDAIIYPWIDLRQTPGLMPVHAEKHWVKWLWSENPQASAISASVISPWRRRDLASETRCCTIHLCGGMPTLLRKALLN